MPRKIYKPEEIIAKLRQRVASASRAVLPQDPREFGERRGDCRLRYAAIAKQ